MKVMNRTLMSRIEIYGTEREDEIWRDRVKTRERVRERPCPCPVTLSLASPQHGVFDRRVSTALATRSVLSALRGLKRRLEVVAFPLGLFLPTGSALALGPEKSFSFLLDTPRRIDAAGWPLEEGCRDNNEDDGPSLWLWNQVSRYQISDSRRTKNWVRRRQSDSYHFRLPGLSRLGAVFLDVVDLERRPDLMNQRWGGVAWLFSQSFNALAKGPKVQTHLVVILQRVKEDVSLGGLDWRCWFGQVGLRPSRTATGSKKRIHFSISTCIKLSQKTFDRLIRQKFPLTQTSEFRQNSKRLENSIDFYDREFIVAWSNIGN